MSIKMEICSKNENFHALGNSAKVWYNDGEVIIMYAKLTIPERLKDLRVMQKHLTLEELAKQTGLFCQFFQSQVFLHDAQVF